MEVVGVVWSGSFIVLFQVVSYVFAEESLLHAVKSTVNFSKESARDEEVYSHEGNHMDIIVNSPPQFSDLLVVEFPSSSTGPRRRKREWAIPPFTVLENDKGAFPKWLFKLKANLDGVPDEDIRYSITGEGADQPPVGLFTVTPMSGSVMVTQQLDREKKALYQLMAHASSVTGIKVKPTNLTIIVADQNDNRPVFVENPFNGHVSESASIGHEFMAVTATDADDPDTFNADVRYRIVSQDPLLPNPNMFEINPVSGGIYLKFLGLDREKLSRYTLVIQAADLQGDGMMTTGTAVITVTDSNDNAPQFDETTHIVSVPENHVGAVVAKLTVTDEDELGLPAWSTKYRIISGDKGGFFNVSTGPSRLEGVIMTVKPLDYEKTKQYILSVIVENDDKFVGPLPTSTATVTVNVEDVNEPPEFIPKEQIISKPEDLPVGSDVVIYTATDPDTARLQKITYKISNDPACWLTVNRETGQIKIRNSMDRESSYVKDGKYRTTILAVDNDDDNPATGTGTLEIKVDDVNDNAPVINEEHIQICNREATVFLSITDKDGPPYAAPFSISLLGDTKKNWTAEMNENKTGILLTLNTVLEPDVYNLVLRVYDNDENYENSSIQASVCDCKGNDIECGRIPGMPLHGGLGILGGILVLLLLLLLVLLFMRRKHRSIKEPLIPEDYDIRDNIYCYDEEGGGEDDKDFDLSVLHRGLDNRPNVFRNDVSPIFLSAPQYRPRPASSEDISTFVDHNLKAADNDPTAPPYDSLLVFDYEGEGSDAGSLSSLNSSSSENDQDYDFINEWGPRFKKLADLYGGEED
ncbi:B-cadherin [Danio aesculapii]|uniref:B-cadherin n=1 Tax=Danio aesculapii TaxID=1142201 RepID=UPI0024C01B4D|nr:B-cadherin [Danio aesculapii]